VATGTGFHSVSLLKAGFEVVSADGSAEMLAKAFENAYQRGFILRTIHADWRWLNRNIHERFDAVICLGAVIRGSTPHFDYVAAEVSKGIASVALETGVPVLFGVITTDTLEQAIERAGSKAGNKGFTAAEAAVEMVHLLRRIGT